jgi:2-amino-4-hydroxy-6-hydroxymethyldihydropteridine diphosphokinase
MPDTPARVDVRQTFVAAGSNVEPLRHLRTALAALRETFPDLTVSPAYRNKAVGFAGDDFINLVVGFRAERSVADVRRELQRIEKLCGRPADAPKWAPRTMDLDILLYGQAVSNDPGLILPRPDLLRRPYMLKPMADLAPDFMHPTSHQTMATLWGQFDAQGHEMERIEIG